MKLKFTLFFFLICAISGVSYGQTLMDVGPHSSNYSGLTRGYWFTAPVDFNITGLRVPTDASSLDQSVEVVRLNAVPPLFPTTTNAYTSLFIAQNIPGTGVIATNIQVNVGDVIGVLGCRGNAVNSYGAGTYNTTISGSPVTLTRFGFQDDLSTVAAFDVWAAASGSIGRVELYYSTCATPTPTIMALTNVLCNGDSTGTATGNATGGVGPYNFAWSNGDSTATAAGLPVGFHTMTVIDDVGCFVDTIIEITEPDSISTSLTSTGNLCFGDASGTATVTAMGGVSPYSYAWPSSGSAASETGLVAGLVTVTVTDDNGCQKEGSVLVTEPAELTVSIDSTKDVTCQFDEDGMIISSAAGGVIPYVVLWDDPNAQASATAINLAEGLYNVMVTDNNNCQANTSSTVGREFDAPVIDLGPDLAANGPFADVVAPTGFTNYEWSTGATGTTVRVFESGTYTVTVTDDNGCTNTDEIVISKVWATGLSELEDGTSFSMYPNPTQGAFTMEISGWEQSNLRLEIMTVSGQVVEQSYTENLPAQYRKELDLSGLAKGLYIVKLTSDRGTMVQRLQLQ